MPVRDQMINELATRAFERLADDYSVVKYTEKGSISVSCKPFDEPEGLRSPKQTAVEIVVADTGCGIEEGKLDEMFREFEQVESSEPRSNAEAGVGVLNCHEIVYHS